VFPQKEFRAVTVTPALPITQPAGLEIEYNHDLNPSEEFLTGYPSIRDALKDDRLPNAFSQYDRLAQAHKRSFQLLGIWSLGLGLAPLLLAAVRLMIGEPAFSKVAAIEVVAELCGVASFVIIFWTRRKRHRVQWCQATFCRERLRQWHFQKFLDGELIGLLAASKDQYQQELDRRWGELQQNLRDGYGMMVEFLNLASRGNDFFHPANDYADPALATQVFTALWTLRFEHQLRYSQRKIEPEGEAVGLALEERTSFSETVATMTLAGAILMSVLAFIASGAHVFDFGAKLGWQPLVVTRVLGGVAMFLAVLSAASRAYRAGYTLPDESESYEEYCDRVRELKAVLLRASDDHEKLRLLEGLEEEAAAELRRFLRMKTRATFVS
jgi:hypothetical protein